MVPTADWAGGDPETTLWTGKANKPFHGPWGTRRVKKTGLVKWMGHWFRAPEDAQIQPEPGEILLFTDYGENYRNDQQRIGEDPIHLYEWSAPSDPDGYVRRLFWVHMCCNEEEV